LWAFPPGPPEDERRKRPTGKSGEGLPHERGKVEPPLKIFQGPDRYGDDRRPEAGREPVAPLYAESVQQPFRQDICGKGLPVVFRGATRRGRFLVAKSDAQIVNGRKRAGSAGGERPDDAAVSREAPADGALFPAIGGPSPDGRGGQVAPRCGKEGGQAVEPGQEPRRETSPGPSAGPVSRISGWKPARRIPFGR
jgi:hypothetical protein